MSDESLATTMQSYIDGKPHRDVFAALRIWLFQRFAALECGRCFAVLPTAQLVKLDAAAVDPIFPINDSFSDATDELGLLFWQEDLFQIFLDPITLTIKPHRHSSYATFLELGAVMEALAPLEGLPVCWLPKVKAGRQMSDAELLTLCCGSIGPNQKRVGRPSVWPYALALYRQEYPDGHDGFSLTSVAKTLGFSVKTIRLVLDRLAHEGRNSGKNIG